MITFVTGIDTGIGKTIAVGQMARDMALNGQSVITQKIAQTGSERPAEDIITHRKIMGIELTEDDISGLTCPYVFPKAASPHLAARLAGQTIDPKKITETTNTLASKYDNVIIEGVGGLHVPLNDSITTLDYLETLKYPTILVTSSRLGSINHTLMSIELLQTRQIPLLGLIYNRFNEQDKEIGDDTRKVLEHRLSQHPSPATITDL
jgi:dethiobiotin synthetase